MVKILTKEISDKLKLLGMAFQKQHKNLFIRMSDGFDARFVIIDGKECYQLDSSIDKHLGKRITSFRRIQEPRSVDKINANFEKHWTSADIIVGE